MTRRVPSRLAALATLALLANGCGSDGGDEGTGPGAPTPPAVDAAKSVLSPVTGTLTGNGSATLVLSVQPKDAEGRDINRAGLLVSISRETGSPGGLSQTQYDAASGTYRATLTAPTVMEPLTAVHYAETLRRWRGNLLANRDRIIALGYDDRFVRLWEFYLCYCEGGFLERAIGTAQLLYARDAVSVATPLAVAAVPPAPAERAA